MSCGIIINADSKLFAVGVLFLMVLFRDRIRREILQHSVFLHSSGLKTFSPLPFFTGNAKHILLWTALYSNIGSGKYFFSLWIAPEKLYASVLIPEIYDLSHKEGDPASREFQRSSSLYSSYGVVEDLLLDLHNWTYIAVLFSSGDKDGLIQLRIGQEGAYSTVDGVAEIVPA